MVATPILFAAALAAGGWAGFALFGPRRWRPTLDRRWAALAIASCLSERGFSDGKRLASVTAVEERPDAAVAVMFSPIGPLIKLDRPV